MNGFYLSLKIDECRTLYVAPLSDRRIESSGQELANASGYFLYEKEGEREIKIIAQFTSEEASLRAGELLNMA